MDAHSIQIDGEHEIGRGWLYTFTITWDDASRSDHELTLAWVDHEHLVGGAAKPSAVARAAAKLAADHYRRSAMPARCDVAILRRRIEGFDASMKSLL